MRKLTILLLLSLWTSFLNAQWVQTSGPEGSFITCYAVSGTNLFAGALSDGVLLSANNGASWTAVNNGLTNTSVTALAISPNGTGGTNLFAGTQGGGVFFSTNNGTSWTAASTGLTNLYVYALAVSGTNLFAAVQGAKGVFLSTDNGTSWNAVNSGLTNTDVHALAVSPNGTGGMNLFAGTSSGNGGGVFLSTDNGTSWVAASSGLTNTFVTAFAVSPNGTGGTNLFAGTNSGGVCLSINNGTSWTAVNNGLTYTAVTALTASGANVFAGTMGGVFLSTDNAANWNAVTSGTTSAPVMALLADGSNVFAGTWGAAYLSTNSGTTWTSIFIGLKTMGVNAIGVSGSNLFAATQGGGVFLSGDNGTSWNAVNNGLTNTVANTIFVRGTNLFAGTYGGAFLSTNSGSSWTAVNNGLTFGQGVWAFASIGSNLFAGTGGGGGVSLSTDNGTSWTAVNNGLTTKNVYALAVSGSDLFVGTNGRGVFRSTNNGTNWTSASGGLTNLYVYALAVSGTKIFAGTLGGGAYLSIDNGASWTPVNSGLTDHNVTSFAIGGTNIFAGTYGGVFLTTDNGTGWAPVSTGLPNSNVWSLAISGANLFAGTENAIWLRPLSEFLSSYTISGNAGVAGATLSYTDGTPKTATADGSGAYSFTVSGDWSGIVTPSLAGNHFTPPYISYTHVTSDQVSQNYMIAAASELQQIVLAQGYSAAYFYRNSPRFDGIAARGDGKLLVVMESAGNQGVYLAAKGQWWNPTDAYSSVGTPFNSPDDMIFARNGTTYVVDNGSWEVIQIPVGGGVATPFVTRTSIPTFDPLGITIAPVSFNGPKAQPGDVIVADNAQGGPARAVWAIDPATGNVRGAIAQGPSNFNDGPIQVAFGLDGRLFVYENSSGTGYGRLVTIDAAGNVTPFLTNIPGTGNLAIHPVTGDIFFTVWKSGVPGAKILRIPAKIIPPQTYPGSAVEVASGFSSLQDMEFSPDGNTLFVSARISTTWDILAISTPPQLTVDWYLNTPTSENHQFRQIAVDRSGSMLYICDSGTDLVYIYRNDGSNTLLGSFGDPSWQTTMIGPYGIDVADDGLVYIAVAKSTDAIGNLLPTPEHSLWRWDGSQLTKLCDLQDFPRSIHVSGVGTGTVVYVCGTTGKVIRCTPITSNLFSAQILFTTGILLNQQDVVANRAQSSIYVSSWYDSNSPYNDPVTKWDNSGHRDVGFAVGCARRGNTPGVDLDRSESSLYLFNIQNVPGGDPPGVISEARLYKVDATTGSGISCVTLGPGGIWAGGGVNVGRDGKIYVARTFTTTAGGFQSSWGRVTDLMAATPPEFQAPAGTASEVYAEGIVRPVGLAVDGLHRLLVAESGTGNIYRYDSKTSKVLLAYGFDKPFDLLLKGDVLYVVDQVAGKIFEKNISVGTAPFSKSSFSEFSSNLEGPTYAILGDLAGYSGKLLVSAGGGIRLAGGGNSVFMNASTSGSAVPQGMVITPTGDLYVCVQGAGTTLKAPLGISTPADPKTLASVLSGLDSPGGIALGTDDRLYVATKENIIVSRRDSKVWTPFVAGLSGGEFNNIEYAGNGEFYVADYLGNRILRVALPQTQRAPSSFPLVYKINESGHPAVTDGTAFTAIQNSFQHWQDIPTCAVTFQDGGRTPSKYASMTDGVNLVTFADDQFPFPPGVLAVAAKTLEVTPGQATATIIDADIVFNPEFVHKTLWGFATDTYPGLPDSLTFDIESIATHEIGHILGLIHSGAPPASMFFVLQPRKNGRTLKPDDVAWASYRYPDGNFKTAYGSIKGKISYGYDGSLVAGGLLIAENTSTGAYYHSYSDADGNYLIPGLPPGSYKVLLRALNGLVFGYPMTPANVSAYLYSVTKYTDYPGEYWNDPDGTDEDRNAFTLVTVTAGAERSGINFVTNKDITAPTVAGVSPANSATGVDVFTQVAITFSEAVDPGSITSGTVRLSSQSGQVPGTYLLINNNKTLLFTPSERLSASTVYTVNVTSGVKDLRGNALTPAFTSSFTTGQPDLTPPTVTQYVPEDRTSGVLVTAPVYVKFSKRMDPATITESSFYLSPSIPGIITVTQDNVVATFTPSGTLAEGTPYTIHVTSSIKDAWGNSFAGSTSGFTTALSGPPSVVNTGPVNGATGVSVTSPILIDFSKPIDPATVNSQSISLSVDSSPVGGTFELLKDNSRVIFRPSAPLLFGKTYRISITTGIRDFANRNLTGSAEVSFTTATLTTTPVITSIDPPAAPAGTTIVIAGSGFDPNPARNTISFVGTSSAIIAGASSSSSGSITTVVPDGALAGINNVTVKVTNSSAIFLFDVLMPLQNPQDNIIASASTESQPKNAAITPDGAFAYVSNFASNSVSIIALGATQPNVTRIDVGSNPFGIAITPDGKRAYVTNYGSNNVSIIDLVGNSVIATASVGISPRGVTVTPDGSRVYVANSGSNSISVIDADPFSGAYNQIIAGASTPSSPKDVEVSPDGTLAIVTGGKFLLIIDINPASASYNQIIGQASTNSETKEVAVSPDGTIAFVTTADGSILLINVYPKSPGFGQIIAGASTSSGADQPAPSPDGTRLYVTNRASNTVTVYDIAYSSGTTAGTVSGIVTTGISLRLLQTIQVGTAPTGIAIDPHNNKVVVVNSGSNNVTIISVSGVSDVVLQSLGQLIGKTRTLIDKPGTSKQAAGHLKKVEDALRDAEGLITGGDISHAFDRFREAIHELGLASSATVVVSDIIGSLAQAAAKLVQDALTAARAFPATSQVNKQIADAEADVQKAKAYQVKGDFEKAMTSYKNAWDKAQLAIKLAQQTKGPKGGKPQGQDNGLAVDPTDIALGQNYPNPFNSTTQIVFDIPAGETGGLFVELKVYNILGQLVRTLVNEVKAPGRYVVSWNGKHDDGRLTASGMYLVRFKAGNFQQTRRVVLIQ